jgi:hypothetical protein
VLWLSATVLVVAAGILLHYINQRGPKPQPPAYPSRINVVLDTSASMQGYFNGQTDFKKTLYHLVTALDKLEKDPTKPNRPKPTIFQYATNSGCIDSNSDNSASFLNKLINNNLTGQDSLLQEMFRNVVAESSGAIPLSTSSPVGPTPCPVDSTASTLSILVTDSIFSYPDADIKKNREVNKENIEGLASVVQIIFNDAHKEGKSVSLLALKSEFHGTYYNYQNRKVAWGPALRPYYLWIIGSPANVRAVREFLQAEGIRPEHALDFGTESFDLSPVILQYTKSRGLWHRHNGESPKRITIVRPSDDNKKELGFAVALDLSRLSSDQLGSDYLRKHLLVQSQSPDLLIKNVDIKTRAEIESELDKGDRADIPRESLKNSPPRVLFG